MTLYVFPTKADLHQNCFSKAAIIIPLLTSDSDEVVRDLTKSHVEDTEFHRHIFFLKDTQTFKSAYQN